MHSNFFFFFFFTHKSPVFSFSPKIPLPILVITGPTKLVITLKATTLLWVPTQGQISVHNAVWGTVLSPYPQLEGCPDEPRQSQGRFPQKEQIDTKKNPSQVPALPGMNPEGFAASCEHAAGAARNIWGQKGNLQCH